MVDSARPLCDCPEPCACQPCQVKQARLQKVMTLMARTSPRVRTGGSLGAGGPRQPALKRRPFPRKCRRRDTQVHDTGRGCPARKSCGLGTFEEGWNPSKSGAVKLVIIYIITSLGEFPRPWKQRTSATPFSPLPSTSRKTSSCRAATMMRPRPSPMGSATPRPPTPAASTKPHGTSSASRPSSLAGNDCRPNPRQSPSSSATWPWKTTRHQMMASFTEKPTEDLTPPAHHRQPLQPPFQRRLKLANPRNRPPTSCYPPAMNPTRERSSEHNVWN